MPHRLLRILPALALLLATLVPALRTRAAEADAPRPALAAEEQAAGWKLLFDGVSTKGWRGLGQEDVPACWVVEKGCLKCLGGSKNIADLVAVDKYDNFELYFEWAFPHAKGNSGVKYRVQEKKGEGYAFGCEYQCLIDPKAKDDHASGALYDVVAPTEPKVLPPGEFNKSRIVVRGNHVEHWLNGAKVVEAEFGSEAMQTALAKSYFHDHKDWGKEPLGYVALQNHHNKVLFRNIKIRVLAAESAK